MALTVRRGDTHPVYWQILDDVTKLPIDLAGATAELHVKGTKPVTSAIILTAIVEEAQDRVRHDLTGLLAIGTYSYEIELTKDGAIMTAPTKTNGTLIVVEDLA